VRGKRDRQKLEAGDCECCRDVSLCPRSRHNTTNQLHPQYYEAIGPLPIRQQPPLWRSPSSTPVKARQRHDIPACRTRLSPDLGRMDDQNDLERRQAIASHKQAISRHRHRWARASTPPGYWNIGFPTTQEAVDINKQAREMHREKRESIKAEAERKDGKYRRR